MLWPEIVKISQEKATSLGNDYLEKLNFEIKEIEKQAASQYWVDLLSFDKKFDTNKNGLLLPFLVGITAVDPIKGESCLYIGDESGVTINGIEIILENGTKIETSPHTLINTKRGYIKASELAEDDEII